MKQIKIVNLILICMILISGCKINTEQYVSGVDAEISSTDAGKEFVSLKVSNEENSAKLNGFGAEWDPHFWMPYNWDKINDVKDWYLIEDRVKELGVDRFRIMWRPEWHEPSEGRIIFDRTRNRYIESILRQLDFMENNGIRATIAFWGAATDMWLGTGNAISYWSEPNDDDAYAKNIADFMKFLIEDRGYTIVDELIVFNEPSLGYYGVDDKISFENFASMFRKVDAKLREYGIRDKIILIGSDDSSGVNLCGLEWFTQNASNLNKYIDGYSTHNYAYSSSNSNYEIFHGIKRYVDVIERYDQNAFLNIHEFGTNRYLSAYHVSDLNTYERALYLPQFAINVLNAGGAGALYWMFYDQFYYDGPEDQAKMNSGLWGFKTENWSVRPMYHSWGLITKYTSYGSKVYPITSSDEGIAAVALKDKGGKTTYLIHNNSFTEKDFIINNTLDENEYFSKYVFDETKVTKSDKLTGPDKTKIYNSNGSIKEKIGSRSFIVLRQE